MAAPQLVRRGTPREQPGRVQPASFVGYRTETLRVVETVVLVAGIRPTWTVSACSSVWRLNSSSSRRCSGVRVGPVAAGSFSPILAPATAAASCQPAESGNSAGRLHDRRSPRRNRIIWVVRVHRLECRSPDFQKHGSHHPAGRRSALTFGLEARGGSGHSRYHDRRRRSRYRPRLPA